jgi:mgtE-like transporter
MSVREVAARGYREALPVLAVSAGGGLFAGVVLGGMEAELEAIPGLLLLVPALLAIRGNVYGSLGARLASALHQGLVEPRLSLGDRRVRAAVAAAISNGLAMSLFAATVGFLLVLLQGRTASLAALLGIALIAGLVSGVVLTTAVVTVVFVGYRRGLDPDALAGPVVTTTGDVVGLATMLFAARTVIALGLVGGSPA